MRSFALVLMAGCGSVDTPLSDLSVAVDLAGDMAPEQPDMTTIEYFDGGYCFVTGADCTSGITSGQGNMCCSGLCNVFSPGPEVCLACGTPGLPCCTGIGDGGGFCGLGRDDVRSFCDNGKCNACGKLGQECCGGPAACEAAATCARCASNIAGQFTYCQVNDCGTVGKACCWGWPGTTCDNIAPSCTTGTCVIDASDHAKSTCQ